MSELRYTMVCRICAQMFQAGRFDARYCGAKCRKAATRIESKAMEFCAANGIPLNTLRDRDPVPPLTTMEIVEGGPPLSNLEVQIEVHRFLETFPKLQGWIRKMLQTQIVRQYCQK